MKNYFGTCGASAFSGCNSRCWVLLTGPYMSLELFQLAKGFGFSCPQYKKVEAHELDKTFFNGVKCCKPLFLWGWFFVGKWGEIVGKRGTCYAILWWIIVAYFLVWCILLAFLCCILNVEMCSKDQISASLYSFHISSAAAPRSDLK